MNTLTALPVLLPFIAAGVSLFGLPPWAERAVSTTTLAVVLAAATALLALSHARGPLVVHVGGWPAPAGIALVADRLSTLLLTVSALVALAVLLFAIGQGTAEERPGAAAVLHPAYLVLVSGVSLAYLSGDLFNLFVAFEVMLGASYVLITLDARESRTRAGMTYTIVSLTSSLLFLSAVAFTYAATGTVTLAQLTARVAALPEGLRTVLGLLLLTVFGIKAALVPLHFWLPDSYPTAPAPITAVFAALLTKVGLYALLRTQTLIFPRDGAWVLLAAVAVTTMLVGILGAIAQDDIHRLLSFTLVSHIGFMLFGLALFDTAGLTGTILYMVHHIVVMAALFLTAGLVVRRTGTAALHRMKGLGAPSTRIAVLFALPALSISGVPPFSGFVAKVALLRAGISEAGPTGYALAAAAVFTSLLTLYAMAKVWNAAFWGEPDEVRGTPVADSGDWTGQPRGTRRGAVLMLGSTAAMAVTGVLLAVSAGPLARVAEEAAQDLVHPQPYRSAVLTEEEP
ncbi:Na+/H+ antiporter subunit D [Streptomyces sp. TRM49041]|uniref:Na+/H+ antiporter subunit D n=1 Tax=Streptomyces sp. TRM49041 TaxID=2603216 RepID=UPI00165683D9|nr:Na+/H+ antiporter subunit D [Streptomyces sp. TRM49041]